MIKGRCPTCRKAFEVESLDALPSFPFCSSRCKLIDLGRWIDGVHAIPGVPARGASSQGGPASDDPDDAED